MTENLLDKIDEELRICREYLAKSGDEDSLKPLLVRLLLVGAYGAYEKAMRNAVGQRAENSSDKEFVRYLGEATRRHEAPFGGIRVDDLRVLENDYPEWGLLISSKAKAEYKKLAKHRHAVAHGGKTDIRWEEMQDMHNMAKMVPEKFVEALRRMPSRAGRRPCRNKS